MTPKKPRKTLNASADKFIFGELEPESADEKPSSSPPVPEPGGLLEKLQKEESPKERPIRVSLDLSPEMHRRLTNLANRTGRKKSEVLRILLAEALAEVEGGD
ncbi:ribbon-helix-helix domain-containing protein [Coleofasciculus sp. FACHB-129]|uniref:ribbon-helix-helix domain-containing protein n=1 Tax=Cyanophyceae TaxID=3028117 RepID=UPI001686A1FB|nr:ribbon-helix-helix domain-containing protein [Coleofasciculus sp. FACHB-129]MBD1893103.1 ribbon-helix-helix protein, CopG family [Coleofasciculus sp. FACHB-129]